MTKQTPLRLTEEEREKAKAICQVYDITFAEFVRRSIQSEYDVLQGNPQLKEVLEKLNELNKQLKNLGKGRAN